MTASLQPESKSPSRRALLAGALGGLGAWAASAIGRTGAVRGANGDVVTVGGSFTGTFQTQISNPSNGPGFVGVSESGFGIYGSSGVDGIGVYGAAGKQGVWGQSYDGFGIHGQSGTGWAGYFDGRLLVKKYVELVEIATPSAPGSNHARLFVRDNGSGKTQLCVRFHSGAVKVLAIQP
jgi:hypothetical protein